MVAAVCQVHVRTICTTHVQPCFDVVCNVIATLIVVLLAAFSLLISSAQSQYNV